MLLTLAEAGFDVTRNDLGDSITYYVQGRGQNVQGSDSTDFDALRRAYEQVERG